MSYESFIASKAPRREDAGPEPGPVHESLFPFQRHIVEWAIRRGRAAIFADCGLGKTRMQLEWLRQCAGEGIGLIVAPLGVAEQTIAEAAELGLVVKRAKGGGALRPGLWITNYERIEKFVGAEIQALVLDESSILKSESGKTRSLILHEFAGATHDRGHGGEALQGRGVPYRLACTATPAPNDVAEMANHAEFVGAMSRVEMLASFFIHDDSGWRLKGHAEQALWQWVASWAVFVRKPSDLGFSDDGFELPALSISDETVPCSSTLAGGVVGRSAMRRETLAARVARAAEVIQASDEQWLVWCGLNDEGRALAAALGTDCVLVEGKDSESFKLDAERRWREGGVRVLISKPSIFGFGMNWQHCSRMLFLGLGDSYEQYYQAIRRCYRFGQTAPVDVRIVVSEPERVIVHNVREKEREAVRMAESVLSAVKGYQSEETKRSAYVEDEATGDGWRLKLGDCVERVREIESESVGLSVFSPPFATLYTYSDSDRDMGNSRDYDEFFGHFGFLLPELLRVTIPGRRIACHVQQVTTTKATHGRIGWRDFRADTVKAFSDAGWIYDGEVVIDKCPQAQAIRTKSKQLMFVQKERDSAWLRPAMADYILLFRKPGENPTPIQSDVSNEEWISWARPIWYGIKESDTLQFASARDPEDEKHICPLQLGTIERCVRLWSNPGELVLSPFAGIGSEGYVALTHGRRFVGVELKPSYWQLAVKHLGSVKRHEAGGSLFDFVEHDSLDPATFLGRVEFHGAKGWAFDGQNSLSRADCQALCVAEGLSSDDARGVLDEVARRARKARKAARS